MRSLKTGWDKMCVPFAIRKKVLIGKYVEGESAVRVAMKPYNMVSRLYPTIVCIPMTRWSGEFIMCGVFYLRLLGGNRRHIWKRKD